MQVTETIQSNKYQESKRSFSKNTPVLKLSILQQTYNFVRITSASRSLEKVWSPALVGPKAKVTL